MTGQQEWQAFYTLVREGYWPSLNPEERIEKRPTEGDAVPDDVWQAALVCFPDPEAWLNNPIPNLDGSTPLEALKAGQTDRVRAMIRDVSTFMLPDPSDMRPWEG